jgi:PKD repeat protein
MKKITFKFLLPVFMLMMGNLAKSQTCTASFVYSLMPNGGVNFYSTSTPQNTITSQFYWNFGNSTTYTSTGNPTATTTYTANGTYTVSLFFLAPMTCSNMTSAVITITNVSTGTCNLNANFTWNMLSNGNVQFNNTSTGTSGGTTYLWHFGNSSTSTNTSPSHQYASNGSYTVTLVANNNFSVSCVDSVTYVINVTNICQLNAGFTYSVSGGVVNFFNTTTPTVTTTYTWTFGNNSLSNQVNPSTTYTANGTYTVTLFAHSNSPNCNSSITQTITITNSSTCNINANFGYSQGSNGLVNFNNTSTGTNGGTTYSWNFAKFHE